MLNAGEVALKLTANVLPETVTAFVKFKSKARPAPVVPSVTGEARVIVGLPAAVGLSWQIALGVQAEVVPVMVTPVLLKNVILELVRAMVAVS